MSLGLLAWRREMARLYAGYRDAEKPEDGWRQWRAGRDALYRDSPDSPLPVSRREPLPFAPYDPALRFEVPLDTDVEPERLEVSTGTDGVVPLDRIGVLHLPGVGDLDAWWLGSYGGGLFVPMRDATAGSGTYGGGRYLLDTVKGADHGGALVVDLNLAYHPSCAYDPAWACPLAPPGNVIGGRVDVGEQLPDGGWY